MDRVEQQLESGVRLTSMLNAWRDQDHLAFLDLELDNRTASS